MLIGTISKNLAKYATHFLNDKYTFRTATSQVIKKLTQ